MRTVILLISSFLLVVNLGSAQFTTTPPDTSVLNDATNALDGEQDGKQIKKLQWYSPHGELPGTYEEYIKEHPLVPAEFSGSVNVDGMREPTDNNVSILVDATLYPEISASVDQYITDLQTDGYSVYLETISGGTPVDIKTWIHSRYNEGCSEFVLVGNITAAWAEISGSVFPCDLYYMDLDGTWQDNNHDDVYEIHSEGFGDMGPEVYVGRIYAYTLDYDTEANMVNDYFAKAHSYRLGQLAQPWRGLEYVEEDWYDMDVYLDLVYEQDVTRHDYGYFTTATDYLDQMDLGQHFVQVCVHSYSGGHHFGTRPTESATYAHVYVNSPTNCSAKLLLGSNDGIKAWLNGSNVYTNDRYGDWSEDDFIADVSLNSGWNQLLCKISQRGGSYELSARFTDVNFISFSDLQFQIGNPESSGVEAEFVRNWLLNGFHEDISDNFWYYLTTNYLGVDEGSINPARGDTMGGETWTLYGTGCPYVDLSDHDDQDFGACYAFARVHADSTISCQLWIGYDDGARVWLNGAEILYDNRYGEFEPDTSKIDLSLNEGENRLLVKVSEWMGSHGFSARFCHTDGSPVSCLSYDPEPTSITHVGTWLINGPYVNPDEATRLGTDYLGDEASVVPNEGDSAPFGAWERYIGDGCPTNIGSFYDNGDWVLSETIQEYDPPVLFYNLFACGPGRFTDDNYLAGAYIFNTTYGLITVASAKSGSMLYFDDFTRPLSENKSIGQAYREWFDSQAPFELWEQEWYYGMVLCGDPTLRLVLDEAICGDADSSEEVDIDDVVYLITYIFAGGPPPDPLPVGDADCSGGVDIDDVVYLITYIFSGGPSPCDTDGNGDPDC